MQRYSQGPTELLGLGVLSRAVRSLLSSREKRVFLCAARSRQHWQAGLSPVLVGGCTMSRQTSQPASQLTVGTVSVVARTEGHAPFGEM